MEMPCHLMASTLTSYPILYFHFCVKSESVTCLIFILIFSHLLYNPVQCLSISFIYNVWQLQWELAVSWSLLQHCTFTQCLSCLILDFTITLREWYYNHHLHKNSLANGIYSPRFIIYNFFLFFALMVVWGLVVGVSDRVFGVGVFSLRGLEPVV